MRLVAEGRYRPAVGRVVDFEGIPDALRDLASRHVLGRVVARIA